MEGGGGGGHPVDGLLEGDFMVGEEDRGCS